MTLVHTPGERLFARYAYSPNELGYCGPAGAAGLAAVARGEEIEFDVPDVASHFSGAWVYQVIIGRLLGLDPLDETVVRGYWTGNTATAGIDRAAFWDRLIAVIGPRAGAYWKHLGPSLAPEAAPSHAFHVLGVYPWSRLLDMGRPEPIGVLGDCCVRPATVTAVGPSLTLATAALVGDGKGVRWEETAFDAPALFDRDLAVGDRVAVHWGSVCDRLTEGEFTVLSEGLADQTDRLNARLAG